jgi:N-acetylmuramic acid 6-phosphate etherase
VPSYDSIPTEQPHPDRPELDMMSAGDIAQLLLDGERVANDAVAHALPAIAVACEWATETLRNDGRIFYVGAGTSGRLGVMDAAEMGPTFGIDDRIVGVIAGGPAAVTEAVEGAEDLPAEFQADKGFQADKRDLVMGITMSGTARFVESALADTPARTILLTANAATTIAADHIIALPLGPEVLAGSTRLKGGSATKTVLNMISTAAMAGSGAVYGPWMVAMRPTNKKLRDRAERLVATIGEVSREEAARLLPVAEDNVRVAILMARGLDPENARNRLRAAHGSLRTALGETLS